LHQGEVNPFEESADADFLPDIAVADGQTVFGDGFSLTALLTPGHCANHACFALDGTGIVFSADHVMAWATSVVAPPDGAMADYMASLERMLTRNDTIFYPGHGGPVHEPASFMRGLRTHRRMRERAILERIRAGDRSIADMVQAIYRDTDPRLHGAAGLSVLAHLEDLVEKGLVITDGPASLLGTYHPAR
jgi:glyoxylase-like metal-dependent hydrolase (beta-lactamase superfamily II)